MWANTGVVKTEDAVQTVTCGEVAELLKEADKQRRHELQSINNEHRKISDQRDTARLQQLLDCKQKLGHRTIFAGDSQKPRGDLLALESDKGEVTTDPTEVQQIIEAFFNTQQQAPKGVKHGQYLPHETPRL